MPTLTEVQTPETGTSLLERIRARGEKRTQFGHGILTADRWVKNMQQVVGLDTCYKFASRSNVSYDDALRKAAQTLTYSNEDMVVQEKTTDMSNLGMDLPKNTLMVFKHVLTTPRKDRDGDILRTEGAELDPRMLLLWQHVHTLPIGKMLGVVEHTKDHLVLMSAIVDMNELSHDAATMIDNDMGRFSHGFRAVEWEEMKSEEDSFDGYDIKRFEIMEESLVSVPSNADAEVSEVMLSMVEGGKLTSGIMKEYGKQLRAEMPIQIVAGIKLSEKEDDDENQSGDRSAEAEGVREEDTRSCAPEEAKNNCAEGFDEETKTSGEEVTWEVTVEAEVAEEKKSKEPMSEPLIEEREITAQEAMAIFLAKASSGDKSKMLSVLKMFAELEEQEAKSKQFKAFLKV